MRLRFAVAIGLVIVMHALVAVPWQQSAVAASAATCGSNALAGGVRVDLDAPAPTMSSYASEQHLLAILRGIGVYHEYHPRYWNRSPWNRIPDAAAWWGWPSDFWFIETFEVKAGTGGQLNSTTSSQANRDYNTVVSGGVEFVTWHFYPGGSGYVGPSSGLNKCLTSLLIGEVAHYYAPCVCFGAAAPANTDKPASTGQEADTNVTDSAPVNTSSFGPVRSFETTPAAWGTAKSFGETEIGKALAAANGDPLKLAAVIDEFAARGHIAGAASVLRTSVSAPDRSTGHSISEQGS